MKRFIGWMSALLIVAMLAWGALYWLRGGALDGKTVGFRTEEVGHGELESSISASGTLEPEELVNVGAQVSGKIMTFGTDADGKTVDYGSRVRAGMVLARIDEVLYDAALREAKAQKLQAKVGILQAGANIQQSQAKLELAKRNWLRAKELYEKKAMSKSDFDTSEANHLTALADLEVVKAELEAAKAKDAIADAALVKAERNLSYCLITSPVEGVVIDRRASVGQTLVSNMSASSLFLIATDLKKMQVWVSVNEADIGAIKVGMPVKFTVDTFQDREFSGTVHKIRLNATMSQNVVTYVVEVATDNSDGSLLPYLTANVRFIKARRTDARSVSNAALRYTPAAEHIEPEFRDAAPADGERLVWVPGADGKVRPVRVRTGINTGSVTEIVEGDLKPGDAVVNAQQEIAATAASGALRSPFMPQPPQRRRTGTGTGTGAAKTAR